MIRHVIGIDPGTKLGLAYNKLPDWGKQFGPFPMPCPELVKTDNTPTPPKKASKHQGALFPGTKRKGTVAPPENGRCGKIFDTLNEIILNLISPPSGYAACPSEILVIVETSAHFTNSEDFKISKRNQAVASEIRGAIKAASYVQGVQYTELTSDKLNAWVFGGRPKSLYENQNLQRQHLKSLKVNAARVRYGYRGTDDDIADAMHIFAYGWSNYIHYSR